MQIELESVREFIAPGCVKAAPQPADARDELVSGQSLREPELTRNVGHSSADGDPIDAGLETEHSDRAGGRPQESEQAADRGALARAVWPQEAVDLPPIDLELDPADRNERAVLLHEPIDPKNRLHCSSPSGGGPWRLRVRDDPAKRSTASTASEPSTTRDRVSH